MGPFQCLILRAARETHSALKLGHSMSLLHDFTFIFGTQSTVPSKGCLPRVPQPCFLLVLSFQLTSRHGGPAWSCSHDAHPTLISAHSTQTPTSTMLNPDVFNLHQPCCSPLRKPTRLQVSLSLSSIFTASHPFPLEHLS